ncbi:MAG: PAS domain-containing protein [Gammaproteobacteria bacterium]|nr:PAS domain-containing protein [Gammaproteobacteria bacterium]
MDPDVLIDLLSTAVLVLDRNGKVERMNLTAETMLSVSETHAIGMPLDQVFPGLPAFVATITRALREGQTLTERDLEIRMPGVAAPRIADCTVTPLLTATAAANGAIVELTDVSHHQRIQNDENMTTQSQITNNLLRGLAHEVKNPLGGIRGAAQLLERALPGNEFREYTEIIISETDRLRSLVDRMLGPSESINLTPLNPYTVIERVRQLVEAETGGNVALIRDYDPSLPDIKGDRDMLVQALLNIVRNAVHAVSESGGTVTLRTRVQRKFTIGTKVHRLVVRVDVVDNGPGVPPDIASSIFFPMVSGHASGSGLGLPIANTLVHRHGGLIGFKSEPGNTVFTVWLPAETRK